MFSSLVDITIKVGHLQWLQKILLFLTKPTQSRKLFLLTLIITLYFDLPYVYFGMFKLKHISKKICCHDVVSNPRITRKLNKRTG